MKPGSQQPLNGGKSDWTGTYKVHIPKPTLNLKFTFRGSSVFNVGFGMPTLYDLICGWVH